MKNVAFRCQLVAIVVLVANVASANSVEIVKVEELWELNVGEPNTVRNAPQVSMVMSPYPDVETDHFVLLLNHRTEPNYVAGGMQLQQWDGEQLVEYRNGPNGGQLSHTGETISWTQTMSISDGVVTFDVNNGTSQSWENFGGQGYLRKTIATGQANLNGYEPHVSIEESGIGFAGNRVASLTLKRIRWTLSDGRHFEVSAPINIDTDLDPWAE